MECNPRKKYSVTVPSLSRYPEFKMDLVNTGKMIVGFVYPGIP
jgi:hypothetical protein